MDNRKQKVDFVEEARQLRIQAEDLERRIKLARGTRRDVAPHTKAVQPKHGPYYVGDEGPTEQLMFVVKSMLEERPRYFQEILEGTGARDNRIKGVIMRLQREGVRVMDVAPSGTGKALWFIPSDEVVNKIVKSKRATDRR